MRSRFLSGTLLVVALAVLALGVPLALLARHQIYATARANLRQEAAGIAAGLEDRLDTGTPPDLTRYHGVLAGRRVLVTNGSNGSQTASGPPLVGAVERASVNLGPNTVTVESAQRPTVIRAREVTAMVVGLAVLAIATAVLLAVTQARRLAVPLARLADRADALGHGQFAPAPVRSGIAEIDRISVELERSAAQIATMISLQRDFASDAAHQLRTPLTGIGLRLEELINLGRGELREEAEQALAQVERLEAVISSLLARARGDATEPEDLELGALISSELPNWQALFVEVGRSVALHHGLAAVVRVRRAHILSILTCLLDNALRHGGGDVCVSCRVASHVGAITITVRDGGDGVADDIVDHIFDRRFSGGQGSGIGLALARALAEAEGGTLHYQPQPASAFVITLPAAHS